MNTALLLTRAIVGLLMAAHGTQKLFGWFGGHGLTKTGEFFGYLGFHPGKVFAAAAALAELTGGLLVALGLLGPVGPALIISVMIVAMGTVHWTHGLFASDNGIEVPLLYLTAALTFALAGYGPYSIDGLLGLADRWTSAAREIVLAAAVLGGLAHVALRRRPATTARA
jgi:putative oxidoreductase